VSELVFQAIALLSAPHSPPDTTAMQLGFEMERTQQLLEEAIKKPHSAGLCFAIAAIKKLRCNILLPR
jgi:hypothetical protein